MSHLEEKLEAQRQNLCPTVSTTSRNYAGVSSSELFFKLLKKNWRLVWRISAEQRGSNVFNLTHAEGQRKTSSKTIWLRFKMIVGHWLPSGDRRGVWSQNSYSSIIYHVMQQHCLCFRYRWNMCRLNDHFLTDIKTAFYQTKKQNTNTTRDSKLFISTVKFLGPVNTRDFSSTVVRRNGVVSYNYTL